jgi:hypothetical protein
MLADASATAREIMATMGHLLSKQNATRAKLTAAAVAVVRS